MAQYRIEVDHENEIVRVQAWGKLKKEDGKGIIAEARTLALGHDFNIFYDIQQLELEGVALTDFYYLPREQEVFSIPESRKTKVAILVSAMNSQMTDYEFYENVTQNLGFRVKVFKTVRMLRNGSKEDE